MATGSIADIIGRLQKWLPSRWFPTQAVNTDGTVPRIYAQLSGFASLFATNWSQLQYARQQTRIETSTDGWLDLTGQDLFGGDLLRMAGETDAAYEARIEANLFLPANTRPAIQAAVESVTGYPARMIEPWQPNDNARWGSFFWGYNSVACPGQWANGNQRYRGLVVASPPAVGYSGLPHRGWGNFFWGSSSYPPAGGFWMQATSAQIGAQLVYAVINKLRMVGVSVFIKFVAPAAPASYLATSGGELITTDSGQFILVDP